MPSVLTDRQRECLHLLAQGLDYQAIADALYLAHPTVKRHLAQAYAQLGASGGSQAVALALGARLIDPPAATAEMKVNMTAADRFWAKVDKRPADGCWLWTASKDPNGYGRFRTGNVLFKAHVWAWQQEHGPKTPGMDLDHLCSIRACVRPDHLEQVTHRENLLRGQGVSARAAAAKHCPQGHPYSPENTYVNPNPRGGRTCRTCRKAAFDRLNDQRREANAAAGRGKGRNKRTLQPAG